MEENQGLDVTSFSCNAGRMHFDGKPCEHCEWLPCYRERFAVVDALIVTYSGTAAVVRIGGR